MLEQQLICQKYKSPVVQCNPFKKIGIAIASLNTQPIRGKRYAAVDGTEGWYIWGGEFSEDVDFFSPVHVSHIDEVFPQIKKYLSLAPGFSFVIDSNGYEDVWFSLEQSQKTSE